MNVKNAASSLRIITLVAVTIFAFVACEGPIGPTGPQGNPAPACIHDWNWQVIIEPTFATPGLTLGTCSNDAEHTTLRSLYATSGLAYELISGAYRVRKGTVTGGAIVIPAYYNNLPITEIGSVYDNNTNSAFSNSQITDVYIPSGVRSIGNYAFSSCTSLTSITIPAGVTSIGNSAFSSCTSLTSIAIPSGVTSIGGSTFSGCTSLTSITIPAGVTSIGNSAFSNCRRLTSIAIPASVTSIGSSAFSNCWRLTSIAIPTGVTSIGNYAFESCTNLTRVFISASVTSIGNYAFRYCNSLTAITVDTGNQNYASEGGILYDNTKTTLIQAPGAIRGAVIIPASVTTIGNNAFRNCTSLTSISISEDVESIGIEAFSGCSSLTSITIPVRVTSIGDSAFYGWMPSQTIYVRGHASETQADIAWNDNWRHLCYATIRYWNGSSWV